MFGAMQGREVPAIDKAVEFFSDAGVEISPQLFEFEP